jgi:GT2 family glycosyltransferase
VYLLLNVAVLVLNYNGEQHLSECLESLRNQTYKDMAVYLVDNGSSDNSVDFTKQAFPWVKIIRFKDNLGFASGYNEAIKLTQARFIALLNNDTRVQNNWLEELIKAINVNDKAIGVGSKMLLYDNPKLLNHAGAKITPIGGGFDIGLFEVAGGSVEKKLVGAICGGAMLVRRDLFLEVGGFDDSFFAYFEDVDFCWRAWLYGYEVVYVPTSVVYHKFGGSWGRKSPTKVFLGQRNRQISMIKNLDPSNLVNGLMLSSLYAVGKMFQFIIERDGSSLICLIKANLWVLKRIPQIIRKRSLVQFVRKVDDSFLFNNGIICSVKDLFREFVRLQFI